MQTLTVTGTGRYVRMYGTARATAYGYSLWEFQVFGTLGGGAGCGTANAAQGRPATASSTENATFPASAAVDGNAGTRWSSAFADPQWLQVDLGATATHLPGGAELGGGLRDGVPDPGVGQRRPPGRRIYSTTTGTGGTQTLTVTRHRPVRPDERHRPGHRVRLLAVGVRRARHRRTAPPTSPTPTPTGPTRRRTRSGATPAPSRPPRTC